MSTEKSVDHDRLEARLTDPERPVRAESMVEGAAAAASAGEFLLREYGSAQAVERATVSRGRPRVGEESGPSPTVRARITRAEYSAMKQLEEATGRSQSELVREAVHRLLVDHKLVR